MGCCMGWDPLLLTGRSDHCAEEGDESEAAGGKFTAGGKEVLAEDIQGTSGS